MLVVVNSLFQGCILLPAEEGVTMGAIARVTLVGP